MAGHIVTPYEVKAKRKHARTNKDTLLLLASLATDRTVDFLDAVESNLVSVESLASTDGTRTVECVEVSRAGDALAMVFAADVSGEREVVHDGALPGRPVVFTKGNKHVTRFYSCCLLWRPPSGTSGILLVHSPWARGGSKAQVLKLVQRAVDCSGAKAKISADPMIPAKALKRILRQANATKITYSRSTGVTSTFGENDVKASAQAEIDLVVKGSDSVPFRDALTRALKGTTNREKLFTVSVRDGEDGGYKEETFEDVAIDITTPGGSRRYSMKDNTLPTMGFNLTPEFNNVYYGLPEGGSEWAAELLAGITPHLVRRAEEVRIDIEA